MQVIGLLGGVASGKSLVAQQLRDLGAIVLDADRAGHEVLRTPEVKEAVRRRWGEQVFGADGEVERAKLGRIVFESTEAGHRALAHLEQITHPEIGRRLLRQMVEFGHQGAPAVVLDASVMLKAGWDQFCDRIIYVAAPLEARARRAVERGWSMEDFAAREAVQESLEEKQRRAETVIDNSGTVEATQAQVERFWRSLPDPRFDAN